MISKNRLKLSNNITGTMGRQILAGILQLGSIILIARVYGSEVNGQYALALLLPLMLATLLNFGIAPANVYFLGARLYSARAVFNRSIKLAAIISVPGLATGAGLIHFFGESLFPEVPVQILMLALLAFPINLINGFIASIFQGLQKFKAFNITLTVQPLSVFIIILGIVIIGLQDILWLIVANIVGALIALVYSAHVLRNYLDNPENSATYSTKTVLGYGYKAHLSNILAFINYKVDIFLVNFFINPAAAGVYVIAVQLSERLWMLSHAVGTVSLPRISELADKEEERRVLTPLLCRLTLFATALATLLLAILSYPLILVLFGKEFNGAVLPLLILLPGILAGAASRILANDIAGRGRPELNMYMSLLTVSLNVLGNIVLIPAYGLPGAALATTVAYSLNMVMRLYLYWKQTGISPTEVILVKLEDINMLKALYR